MSPRVVMALFVCLCVLPGAARAQSLGTFRWQQQPYCNVFTLNVVQAGAIYQVDGVDDQCGGATRAAVVGLAFLNPNGSIGFGLTVVTSPGGTPVHLDATIDLASLGGTWRDSSGSTGAWAFTPASGTGGSPRPVLRTSFPAGLSAGNATITNLATPVNGSDAATKSYVETFARGLRPGSAVVTGHEAAVVSGAPRLVAGGCVEFDTAAGSEVSLPLPVPLGATPTRVVIRYRDGSLADSLAYQVRVNLPDNTGVPVFGTLAAGSSANTSGRADTVTLPATGIPAASLTNSYYIGAGAPGHVGVLWLCGAEVFYTQP